MQMSDDEKLDKNKIFSLMIDRENINDKELNIQNQIRQ